jgi:pimeloyl-ACP methyl ester carboxylesterase
MLSWVKHKDGALLGTDGFVYEDHYDRIKAPLLLIAGSRDLLAPPAAVEWVRSRAGSQDIEFVLASRATGFSADYGHGDLVLGERAPEEIFPLVVRWLEAHAEALPAPPAQVELIAPISNST